MHMQGPMRARGVVAASHVGSWPTRNTTLHPSAPHIPTPVTILFLLRGCRWLVFNRQLPRRWQLSAPRLPGARPPSRPCPHGQQQQQQQQQRRQQGRHHKQQRQRRQRQPQRPPPAWLPPGCGCCGGCWLRGGLWRTTRVVRSSWPCSGSRWGREGRRGGKHTVVYSRRGEWEAGGPHCGPGDTAQLLSAQLPGSGLVWVWVRAQSSCYGVGGVRWSYGGGALVGGAGQCAPRRPAGVGRRRRALATLTTNTPHARTPACGSRVAPCPGPGVVVHDGGGPGGPRQGAASAASASAPAALPARRGAARRPLPLPRVQVGRNGRKEGEEG